MKLNLGCGYRKLDGFINIDNRTECNPDLIWDLSESIPFEDDSIDEIAAIDFIEHVETDKCIHLFEEMYRALRLGGLLNIFVPSTDGRGAFQDLTHKSYWNSNSFWYFMEDEYIHLYGIKAKFEGSVQNKLTDPKNKIVHVVANLKKVPL